MDLVNVYNYAKEKSCAEIARKINISKRSVERICKRFQQRGTVESERIGRSSISHVFHSYEVFVLLEYVLKKPAAYLKEI